MIPQWGIRFEADIMLDPRVAFRTTIILVAMFAFLFRGFGKDSDWVPDPDRKLAVYIGWPLKAPSEWKKAKAYDRNGLELEDGTFVKPRDVQSHLLVYPNNEAMGGTNLFYPFPANVKFLEPKSGPKEPLSLNSIQLEYGKAVCKVSHSRVREDTEGKPIYATTLRNISGQRIRIQRFAGFRRAGQKYVLHTVTGGYYTEEQFIAWYAAPRDGWIPAGGQVTDENNYGGGDGIWAYFGQTEDGNHFIATDPFPR
jgi:hypothetical protein